MSERGSFVTEFIYCQKCLEVVKKVLISDDKYLRGVKIPGWTGLEKPFLPIIAGKIGGLYCGEEADTMEFEYIPEIEKSICHPVRIAVLCDDWEKNKIFTAQPSETNRKKDVEVGTLT